MPYMSTVLAAILIQMVSLSPDPPRYFRGIAESGELCPKSTPLTVVW